MPDEDCVEVPVVADRMGFKTTSTGLLPEHLAILVNTTARIESMVVDAAMRKRNICEISSKPVKINENNFRYHTK